MPRLAVERERLENARHKRAAALRASREGNSFCMRRKDVLEYETQANTWARDRERKERIRRWQRGQGGETEPCAAAKAVLWRDLAELGEADAVVLQVEGCVDVLQEAVSGGCAAARGQRDCCSRAEGAVTPASGAKAVLEQERRRSRHRRSSHQCRGPGRRCCRRSGSRSS